MIDRLKDWLSVTTRYDLAKGFSARNRPAAMVIFCFGDLSLDVIWPIRTQLDRSQKLVAS